jgi:hypothetical protein
MGVSTHVQRSTYLLDEASFASGISRSTLYRLIGRGELHNLKLADRRLIPLRNLSACAACNARGQWRERPEPGAVGVSQPWNFRGP